MTITHRATRAQPRHGFSSLSGLVLIACGQLSSSPQDPPDTSLGGDASTARAGTAPTSGAGGGAGGTGGGITIVVPVAGSTSSNTPLEGGTSGEGGQPDHPPSMLCLYPEDIPESWSAGGAVSTTFGECAIGELGGFNFMGCYYELLDTMPGDVDPFSGGHSHCCYSAQLLACK